MLDLHGNVYEYQRRTKILNLICVINVRRMLHGMVRDVSVEMGMMKLMMGGK